MGRSPIRLMSSNTSTLRPEFIRLPSRGPDPIFGLSRSYYYDLERMGKLQLKRLRKPGNLRGIVLIPVSAVSALIEKESGSGMQKLAS